MPLFVNPFKKHNVSCFDVHVPLENSLRQSSIVMPQDETAPGDGETLTNRAIKKENLDVQLGSELNLQAVIGLRAEIDHGMQN